MPLLLKYETCYFSNIKALVRRHTEGNISIVLKAQYTLDNSNSKIAKHIHRSHSSVAFALDRMLMWYQTFSPNYIW